MDYLNDEFYERKGLWRKHIPKDSSCLFRITSEHVYGTQAKHLLVREECVQFIKSREILFEQKFKIFAPGNLDVYLENLTDPKFYGGEIEMNAMSLNYSINYEVYDEELASKIQITYLPNANHTISLLSTSNQLHLYDVLYPYEKLAASAFCQSLVYGILYKNVFELGDDVDYAVKKMLYDREYAKQKRNAYNAKDAKTNVIPLPSIEIPEVENCGEVKKKLAQGTPPFPYTSCKSLDPCIYRNIDLQLFNEYQREQIRNDQLVIPDVTIGVKCLFKPNENDFYHAYIQEMQSDGTATVYILELGERKDVPLEQLTPMPIPLFKAINIPSLTHKTSTVLQNYIKNHPVVHKPPNRRRYNKKGSFYQDLTFFPFMQSTSLLKLTQTQVLSTQNSMKTLNETNTRFPPRTFYGASKNTKVYKGNETKSLTCCKSDYREVRQSTWSMAQASAHPLVANEVENSSQILSSEINNTCMTVSKMSQLKPTEAKSTIVTKQTKTTVKEVNFQAKTSKSNRLTNYKPRNRSFPPLRVDNVVNDLTEYIPNLQINDVINYPPPQTNNLDNDSLCNSSLPQSYNNQNSTIAAGQMVNFDYPNGCTYFNNYSLYPQEYSYAIPYPVLSSPTPVNNYSLVPYPNYVPDGNSIQPRVYPEPQTSYATSNSNNLESNIPNENCATVTNNYCTYFVNTFPPGQLNTNETYPETFQNYNYSVVNSNSRQLCTLTENQTQVSQPCTNNIPLYVVYNPNPNYPITYHQNINSGASSTITQSRLQTGFFDQI